MRTQNLKVLPLKPEVGQHIAMHAILTVGDFFLANFYPSGPFTSIFCKTSPDVVDTVSCVVPQNEIGFPAHCYRQLMQVPVLSALGI